MKIQLIFTLIMLIYIPCLAQSEEAIEILKESQKRSNEIQNLYYKADFKFKSTQSIDTVFAKGDCWIVKDKPEKFPYLGFQTRIKRENNYEIVYCNDTVYSFVHDHKVVRLADYKKGIRLIRGNVNGFLLFQELITGIDYEKYPKETTHIELLDDNESEKYWIIKIDSEYPERNTRGQQKFWINKNTYLPERKKNYSIWEGIEQNDEIIIHNLKTDSEAISNVVNTINIPEDYTIELYKRDKIEMVKLLEIGTIAPDFRLKDLNGNEYSLSSMRGKLVLLDFWYMACMPCIQALPHLEELHRKYNSHDLLVFGVDSRDERQIVLLQEFLAKKDITYPTLLAPDTLDKIYHVSGYPTIYLVGRDGKIKHCHCGYNDAFQYALEKRIEAEINSR